MVLPENVAVEHARSRQTGHFLLPVFGSSSSSVAAETTTGVQNTALCKLAQELTRVDMLREPGQQLAGMMHDAFEIEAVAIFDRDLNKVYKSGQWYADPANQLLNICMFERSSADEGAGLTAEVVRIGVLPIGALLVRGDIDRSLVNAAANLIAVTFDRYHSRANLSRVESAREAERLRTTVLDSLAHAYKTPLTAIRAAATGIIEITSLNAAQSELMSIVVEQTAALNELTMRLLSTARLENHELHMQMEWIPVASLVEDVVAELVAQIPCLPVTTSVSPEDLHLDCDRALISALLTQYLDNAAKYSEFDSLIRVDVRQAGESVVFSVHNVGPTIPSVEFERIFERYVRGSAAEKNTSGTGIGLAIARAAAQAHAGDVWATSDANDGTTFWASLPLRRNERTNA